MTMNLLMAVEGVLAEDELSPSLPTAAAIPEGVALFHALRKGFHVVLSSTHADDDAVRRWLLRTAGILPTHWARLLTAPKDADPLAVRLGHMMAMQAGGGLAYMVDADPALAAVAMARGITPMCCPHPRYSRSSFRPTSAEGGLAWTEIARLYGERHAPDPRLLDSEEEAV